MIDTEKIKHIARERLAGGDMFVVDVISAPGNDIEVIIDSDTSVGIDTCVQLSRAIEEQFDRETEDFQLTVSSAGVGRPLKLLRQYRKLVGKPVEVVLKNGTKIVAELRGATESSVTLSYPEMRVVEGKKRKQEVVVEQEYRLEDIKTTKEYLDFK